MAVLFENIRFAAGESLRLLRWQGNASTLDTLEALGRSSTASGIGGRWHSHPELELTLFTTGSGLRYVGDDVGPFSEMDCVLLGSRLPHCWMEQGRTNGYVLQFHLPQEHPLRRFDTTGELNKLFKQAARGIHFRPGIAEKALRLLEAIATGSVLARAGLLLELLALLAAVPRRHSTLLSQSSIQTGTDCITRPRLENVVQWVLERFTQPLTLDQAVEHSAMSRATFCRQFQKHTGKTFITFLNDARLAYAHQLVTQSQRPITEIAYASGFGSLTRFNAAFLEKFDLAPRKLRGRFSPK
jgi:AraC-like DNA-binding protein